MPLDAAPLEAASLEAASLDAAPLDAAPLCAASPEPELALPDAVTLAAVLPDPGPVGSGLFVAPAEAAREPLEGDAMPVDAVALPAPTLDAQPVAASIKASRIGRAVFAFIVP